MITVRVYKDDYQIAKAYIAESTTVDESVGYSAIFQETVGLDERQGESSFYTPKDASVWAVIHDSLDTMKFKDYK